MRIFSFSVYFWWLQSFVSAFQRWCYIKSLVIRLAYPSKILRFINNIQYSHSTLIGLVYEIKSLCLIIGLTTELR
jgi:hypothetical protein